MKPGHCSRSQCGTAIARVCALSAREKCRIEPDDSRLGLPPVITCVPSGVPGVSESGCGGTITAPVPSLRTQPIPLIPGIEAVTPSTYRVQRGEPTAAVEENQATRQRAR